MDKVNNIEGISYRSDLRRSGELLTLFVITLLLSYPAISQDYWQQRVEYDMNIKFDARRNCMEGRQKLVYHNNSPDVITRVYYHLYFNAFQPNSMMDVRSRTIMDPDPRIGDRIAHLSKKEMGYHKILTLFQDGIPVDYSVEETILVCDLNQPLQPGGQTVLEMTFESQVPIQIRRSGRDNKEGVRFSMAQWYPKLCAYDEDGWHPNPYIGREFYGVWGDFNVSIEIDKDYVVAAGGELMNDPAQQKGKQRIWEFKAENVHDFMWAADPDYVTESVTSETGVTFNFFYQPGERTTDNWKRLPPVMLGMLDYLNEHYGQYPYPVYSFIQGGDGGMEYPMGTLITGERSIHSLIGVCVHEFVHAWYHTVLATNESLYAWMDEGFSTYVEDEVRNYLKAQGLIPGLKPLDDPHAGSMTGYRNFAKTPLEEPLSTHSDHFQTNAAYNLASYTKGAVFLNQLAYIIGDEVLDEVMLDYYEQWKFKHPDVDDFIQIAEKRSGMILDWYKEQWVNSTNRIDYALDTVYKKSKMETVVVLMRKERMMMPVDLLVTFKGGSSTLYSIPLVIMRGEKASEGVGGRFVLVKDWPWTDPEYQLIIDHPIETIRDIVIDPTNRLADIDLTNNRFPRQNP